MDKIYTKARAKVNLSLNVLDKRKDNYHNLESIFQKINLYDELYLEKNDKETLELITNLKNVELENNIIYKAYIKLKEKYNTIKGVKVTLNKRIPTQAGLAGGSTDCASFILSMNKLYNLNLTEKELIDLGKTLGADVCPCYYNKAVKGEGIGDVITPIDTKMKYYMLIIKPRISYPTKDMFEKLDKTQHLRQREMAAPIVRALETDSLPLLCDNLYNVFEDVITEKYMLQTLKNELIQNGAMGTLMTGSGSCVYGIFKNKYEAKKAYDTLKSKYEIYICTSYNTSKKHISSIE